MAGPRFTLFTATVLTAAAALALLAAAIPVAAHARTGASATGGRSANRRPPSLAVTAAATPAPTARVPAPQSSPVTTVSRAPANANVCPPPAAGCYVLGAGVIGSSASLAFSSLSLDAVDANAAVVVVPPGAKNPDVDSQGDLVVFERSPGYLWLIGADGTGLRALSPVTGGGWMEPKFTPDGHSVVATHDLGGGHNEIFEIDVATGAQRQLTNAPAYPWKWRPFVDATGTQLLLGYGTDSNATHGPGSHIGIAPMPSPGQTITAFTPLTPVDTTRPSYDPELSPDGATLLFDAGSHIWIANADGSNAHTLAPGKIARFDHANPSRVLFLQDLAGDGTHTPLFAINLDGSGSTLVADGNYAESFSVIGGL